MPGEALAVNPSPSGSCARDRRDSGWDLETRILVDGRKLGIQRSTDVAFWARNYLMYIKP